MTDTQEDIAEYEEILSTNRYYTVWIKPRQNQEVVVYKEETVQRGDLTVGVTESGSLSFGITSQLYDLELQTEEEKEEEGDPVLKFSDSSIEAIRKKLRATQTEREIALAGAGRRSRRPVHGNPAGGKPDPGGSPDENHQRKRNDL